MALKEAMWAGDPPWLGLAGDYELRQCRCLFLDSGAHSLYNLHVKGKVKKNVGTYKWYRTKAFYKYVDKYAAFVKKHKDAIDYYATVDVIYNPELSWKSLKYLEQEHGLSPVPVIHCKTDLRWLDKHLDAGYKYIGIGGLGQESTRFTYTQWSDKVFDRICSNKARLPEVKIHGFAMTSIELILRYPWYSTDSASWSKAAGFGSVMIPPYRDGEFKLNQNPIPLCFSYLDSGLRRSGKHYQNLTVPEKAIVDDWIINYIKLPIGKVKGDKVIKHGLLTHFGQRAVANLRYFDMMVKTLPKWPSPFHIHPPTNGFFT